MLRGRRLIFSYSPSCIYTQQLLLFDRRTMWAVPTISLDAGETRAFCARGRDPTGRILKRPVTHPLLGSFRARQPTLDEMAGGPFARPFAQHEGRTLMSTRKNNWREEREMSKAHSGVLFLFFIIPCFTSYYIIL